MQTLNDEPQLMKVNQTVKGFCAVILAQTIKNGEIATPINYTVFDTAPLTQQPQLTTLYQYIYRLFRKAQIEPECLVAAIDYLDQFQQLSGVQITGKNFQKLSFIAIQTASKMWDDISCSSKSFALCTSDFSLRDLNEMERLFVSVLKFRLFLDSGDYKAYYYDIKKIWMSLQTTDDCEMKAWIEVECLPSLGCKWQQWGIHLLAQSLTGDVKQTKSIQ